MMLSSPDTAPLQVGHFFTVNGSVENYKELALYEILCIVVIKTTALFRLKEKEPVYDCYLLCMPSIPEAIFIYIYDFFCNIVCFSCVI